MIQLAYTAPAEQETKKARLADVQAMQRYFVKGGPYQRALEMQSTCIDWCMTHALSDPADGALRGACDHRNCALLAMWRLGQVN